MGDRSEEEKKKQVDVAIAAAMPASIAADPRLRAAFLKRVKARRAAAEAQRAAEPGLSAEVAAIPSARGPAPGAETIPAHMPGTLFDDRHVDRIEDVRRLHEQGVHEEHDASDDHQDGTLGRVKDKRYPSEVVEAVHSHNALDPKSLEPSTLRAYERLLAHARKAGFAAPLLDVVSGFRTDEQQAALKGDEKKTYGGDAGNTYVAAPGGSAHRSGRAIDFYLGVPNRRTRVEEQRALPVYKWLVANAAKFGFAPYDAEPWHWECNPRSDSDD